LLSIILVAGRTFWFHCLGDMSKQNWFHL
jgi:hypothetical protein